MLNQPGTNMAGVAAGLAAAGFKWSFIPSAPLPPVAILTRSSSPVAMPQRHYRDRQRSRRVRHFNGSTHMPFEDVALYRVMPTATIIDVTDGAMLQNVLPSCLIFPA